MSKLAQIQALANQAAETGMDMTEAKKGGGGRLLPAGYAFGRLVGYVELGNQPQSFNGQAKAPKPEAQLTFALWGEGYTNDDGTPYLMRMYPFSLDQNEKARSFLLFKTLNWKGTAKNFAQLIGEGYLVKIVHEPKSQKDKSIVSRIDVKGFLPPFDPVTKAPYGIPEAREEDLQCFIWDYPTLDAWNSLFVDGNLEDGRTKNFTQETIVGATNFSGSALEALLMNSGAAIPVPTPPAVAAAPAPGVAAPALPTMPSPTIPATSAATPPVTVSQPTTVPVISAPIVPAMTSPSNGALPSLPSIPALPVMP